MNYNGLYIFDMTHYNELKFIRCACRVTERLEREGNLKNDSSSSKRAETKALIKQLREKSPYIEANIFKSVENVHLNALICYKDKDGNRHHFLDNYDTDN